MAKRFTDTEKWKKPFIRGMKAPYKLLWLYILDECDHAGIWQVDIEVAKIKIGEKFNKQDALSAFSGKVIPIEGGTKWFIPDFIDFQYSQLDPNNRAHNSAIKILLKLNLLDANNKIKDLISPLQGAMDMDMVKDKELDKEKDKPEISKKIKTFIPPSLQEFTNYFLENEFDADLAKRAWTGYHENNWHDSHDNPIRNWKTKAQQVWFKNENKRNGSNQQNNSGNSSSGPKPAGTGAGKF